MGVVGSPCSSYLPLALGLLPHSLRVTPESPARTAAIETSVPLGTLFSFSDAYRLPHRHLEIDSLNEPASLLAQVYRARTDFGTPSRPKPQPSRKRVKVLGETGLWRLR